MSFPRWIAFLIVSSIAISAVVMKARRDSADPARCGPWLVAYDTRCCAKGQYEKDGVCKGVPSSCPPEMNLTPRGCVMPSSRAFIEGGRLRGGTGDWEADEKLERRDTEVPAFEMDTIEVTEAAWEECVRAGACDSLPLTGEPGRPVTSVTWAEAAAFCAFRGGRIPTEDEWTWAARGESARRYPWGDTGAVCRRGAWGLSKGPCGFGSRGPELAGIHRDGRSPEGVLDLAGNVAEWVSGDGEGRVRGGSFASSLATELRGWKERVVPRAIRDPEIGVRCVYSLGSAR